MCKIFVLGILCLFLLVQTKGQQWIKIYGDSVNTETNTIHEHYDKGYILSGDCYNPGFTVYGWILKTDVNGNERWSKQLGNNLTITRLLGSKLTPDGGIIEGGLYKSSSPGCSNPLIVKLNACGEKEWCKIYSASYCYSTCYDICLTNDGGYIALIDHWTDNEEKIIWLFRLSNLGEVIWAQSFATNPDFTSEWSHSLINTLDSCVIITGETYYPDPTYPTKKILKILLIKSALDGTSIFEVPWGTNNGVYSDGRLSAIDSKNNIYTAGRRSRTTVPGGDSPCLYKTSFNGTPVFYKDMKATSSLGTSTTINWFQDSTLVQCMYWGSQVGNDTTGLIKTDILGNLIAGKPLLVNSAGSFYGSDITFNNRLILAGSVSSPGYIQSYAFKLTSNLDYDSIYTTPFRYDSLCPHLIVSDTIPLNDCPVVIVGLDDAEKNPEKAKLHIYPNPAGGEVTIEMPQYLVRKNQGSGITATTTYFQWNQTRLDMLDLSGKLVFSQDIPKQQTLVRLNVSAWHAGMYLARIVFMNEVVAEAKFIKQGKK